MSTITGEVVPTPDGQEPFMVVFRADSKEISTQPVKSQEHGEELIIATLRELGAVAKRDGFA